MYPSYLGGWDGIVTSRLTYLQKLKVFLCNLVRLLLKRRKEIRG